MAVTRILVEAPLAERLASQLVQKVKSLKMGDPHDPETAIGPITSATQLAKIQAHVDDAVAKGATVLIGGRSHGQYFEPTVLGGVTPEMRCYYEETFGPVVALTPVQDSEEAIRLANDSPYGLSAAIITGDPERGMALAERLQTGNGARERLAGPRRAPGAVRRRQGLGGRTPRRQGSDRGIHRAALGERAGPAPELPLLKRRTRPGRRSSRASRVSMRSSATARRSRRGSTAAVR